MPKYALRVMPGYVPLIRHLNAGRSPVVNGDEMDGDHYFVFTINEPNELIVEEPWIQKEDDLYDEGYLKEEMIVLL
jgi:hypothetical protein